MLEPDPDLSLDSDPDTVFLRDGYVLILKKNTFFAVSLCGNIKQGRVFVLLKSGCSGENNTGTFPVAGLYSPPPPFE